MIQKRRRHTKEFKEQAVKLITEKCYSVSEAARNLDVHPNLLSRWKAVTFNLIFVWLIPLRNLTKSFTHFRNNYFIL